MARESETVAKESDWLVALGKDRSVPVTVWLRSGRQVTGTIGSQVPVDVRDATVFRIKEATLITNAMDSSQDAPQPSSRENDVLVSVKDIELIVFNDPK